MEEFSAGKKRVKVEGVEVGTVSEGRGREVVIDGRRLALFRVNGGLFAIANLCLHRGGPLSEGELEGFEVTCPWHGWRYDVRTGSFEIIPTLKVKAYRVVEEDGEVFVEMEE